MPISEMDVACQCGCIGSIAFWSRSSSHEEIKPDDNQLTVKTICIDHLKAWNKDKDQMGADFIHWFRTMVMLSDEERFLEALKK